MPGYVLSGLNDALILDFPHDRLLLAVALRGDGLSRTKASTTSCLIVRHYIINKRNINSKFKIMAMTNEVVMPLKFMLIIIQFILLILVLATAVSSIFSHLLFQDEYIFVGLSKNAVFNS